MNIEIMKCAKVYGVVPTYLPRVEDCQHKKVANEGGTIYQDFISIIFLVFTKANITKVPELF